jgi:DNA repair exonuclease SbcCD ATPase subunit
MKLEFTRLILRDFKEYRGKHVLDLSRMGNGVHYVRGKNRVDAIGSNGAGKSTLWDAFMWCISGRTVRGLRGTDVRTWQGAEHAMSRVDFFCDDEAHHVKRSTEKNGLWLDGKLCSQEAIDRLLGLSIINIPHTILLGQKRDLFFDLKPQHKLDLLSETLSLDKWETRSKQAKAKVTDGIAVREGIIGRRQVLEDMRDSFTTTLEQVKAKSVAWNAEHGNAASARERRIEGLTKSLEAAITEKGTHDLAYDGAETELRAIRKDLIKKRSQMDEILEDISKARTKRDTRKARLDELRALAGSDTCPTCGQPVTKAVAHARAARDALKEAKHLAAVASDRVILHETRKEVLRDAIVRIAKAEDDFADKSNEAKDKLDHLEKHCRDIQEQIAVLKAESAEQANPYAEQISNMRKDIKRFKGEIIEHNEQIERLDRRINRTRYWVKGFKQVRLYLLQETLEELEEVTQNLLPEFGLPGWSVEYDIERETKAGAVSTGLSVKILKPGMRKAVRWEAWSGGEGQRLLIVGAIALSEVLLRRAGIECDLLVLDEPTRHMSKEGVEETVDYLITRGRDAQIFYVDHQVIESNRFASVVTITKDEHGAQIKVAT